MLPSVSCEIEDNEIRSNEINESVDDSKENKSMATESRTTFIVCFIGIFVSYFYYGVLQEKITKGKYGDGDDEEKYTYTLALVFVQCVINAAFAAIALKFISQGEDKTPMKLYGACSLSYLGAMLASNHSLQHITYPTQVLGKSVKPIPVMILGVLLARKRYPLAKYLCVLLIVLGVGLFMYKDKKVTTTSDADDGYLIGIGEFLLIVSLCLDGLTGATQDRMRGEHKTQAFHMMLNVNLFSVLWLAIGLTFSGEGLLFLGFVQRFPWVIFNILSFSLASAIGQTFIFITVTTFGPLTCSIVTTTRKFFTILGSVLLFNNPISTRQWIGTVFVFIGLALDSKYGKEQKKK